MAKTLEDVKAALKALDNGDELIEALSGLALDAESTKKSFSTLTNTHNRIMSELRGVGFSGGDTAAAASFLAELKGKLEQAKELESTLTEKEKKVTGSTAEIQRLEKAINEMKAVMAADKEKATKAERALIARQIKDTVVPKLRDRIYSADLRAERLIEAGLITRDEAGNIVYKNGDEAIELDKGIEQYLLDPSNKDDLKNIQSRGAGTIGTSSRTTGKVMKLIDFNKLPEKERTTFLLKENGEVVE